MLIKVKAFPDSKHDEIVQKKLDKFEVYVREPAIAGRANAAICRILATHFHLLPEKIILVRGARRPNKIFEIKKETPLF